MDNQITKDTTTQDYSAYRSVRYSLKVVFSCLTAIPFFVFAYIYFRIGALNTALSGALVALSMVLVLEGFIIFRKMAEHIENLSSAMAQAEEGKVKKVQDGGETRELAMIADTFNRTLSKLEVATKEVEVRAVYATALNEIRKIVVTTIDMEEVSKAILERTIRASNSQAGYLAAKRDDSPTLYVVATSGITNELPNKIPIDADKSLAGLVIKSNSFVSIEDIEKEPYLKNLIGADIVLRRLLCLPIVTKGTSIGVLILGRNEAVPHFGKEDVQFLQTLLQQVAYGVENARLYENLRQSNRELENALVSQKRAQDQLLTSARMAAFGELSVSIAHELNSPLTGILGYTDIILSSSMNNSQVKENLEKIRIQAVRAGNITKTLLDFVSASPGVKVEVDLNEIVKKTLLLTKGKMLEDDIHLDCKLAEKLPSVMADTTQMGQVIFNLVNNALKAIMGVFKTSPKLDEKGLETTEKRRLLSVRTGKKHDKVYVYFKDTGPGISDDHRGKIFQPFYSTQNKVSQVGLGLWVSNRIVEAHGGVMRVKSVLNKGSIFIVILPSAKQQQVAMG